MIFERSISMNMTQKNNSITEWEFFRIKSLFHFAEKIISVNPEDREVEFKKAKGLMVTYKYNGVNSKSWIRRNGLRENGRYLRQRNEKL